MELLPAPESLTRQQLEHILRAAGSITDLSDFIVVGSQAVLGSVPDAPASLLVSLEADLFPREKPELSDLVDGTIGELSPFHQTFGYYGHGVAPNTAVLPGGWESRLVGLSNENTNGVTGWCLAPRDIAYSKLVAGRPKDMAYVRELLAHDLISLNELKADIEENPSPHQEVLRGRCRLLS